MAKSGGARGPRGASKGGRPVRKAPKKTPPRPTAEPRPVFDAPAPVAPGPFRLGAIPGATPGTWIDRWKERMPQPLELVPLAVRDQRAALIDGDVDAAIVRLPIEREGLHVIPLYDEVAVVVTGRESHLTAADELEYDDLVGEIVIVPLDDVLSLDIPGALSPSFAPLGTTEEAVATVASGVGAVVVPMSLARLHQRRDAAHRVLRGAPASTVALAWVADRTTPAVEAFVGIIRGRTANSSRD
ncbi:MAG: LysR substrate-binding domain-containing protein [Microbacterium sp.]